MCQWPYYLLMTFNVTSFLIYFRPRALFYEEVPKFIAELKCQGSTHNCNKNDNKNETRVANSYVFESNAKSNEKTKDTATAKADRLFQIVRFFFQVHFSGFSLITRRFPVSATYTMPFEDTAIPQGVLNWFSSVPGLPKRPCTFPSNEIFVMREWPYSAM